MQDTRQAFTLVELSIVLVIIGLIVGGVLVGQDLIRASRIQATVSEIQALSAAVNTFEEKYNCLPGDCPKATTFWGAAPSCGPIYTPGTQTQSCNGNGNGKIEHGPEEYAFWQHLSNAGLVPWSLAIQTYEWTYGYAHIGISVPPSKISGNAGYDLMYVDSTTPTATNFFNVPQGNMMFIGAFNAGFAMLWRGGVLSDDAALLDRKIDDGSPATGSVQGMIKDSWLSSNCATSDVASTAQYATGTQCVLLVNNVF